jgi:hypothetical protein
MKIFLRSILFSVLVLVVEVISLSPVTTKTIAKPKQTDCDFCYSGWVSIGKTGSQKFPFYFGCPGFARLDEGLAEEGQGCHYYCEATSCQIKMSCQFCWAYPYETQFEWGIPCQASSVDCGCYQCPGTEEEKLQDAAMLKRYKDNKSIGFNTGIKSLSELSNGRIIPCTK